MVKGLDKFTPIRLAEALTQKGAVPGEVISDSLYAQEHGQQSFVELLIESGTISEWDLAKIVVDHFQLPFLTASNYQSPAEIKDIGAKELFFETLIVPLDIFDEVLTVTLPVYASSEVFSRLERETKKKIFPYVGLVSENRKILGERFEDFRQWEKDKVARLEASNTKKPSGTQAPPDGWQNIFDVGDQSVRQSLG